MLHSALAVFSKDYALCMASIPVDLNCHTEKLIASRLGMEPETFSRGLATLKDHGIKAQNAKIVFCDIEAMEDFVCDHCSMAGECPTHYNLSSFPENKNKKSYT